MGGWVGGSVRKREKVREGGKKRGRKSNRDRDSGRFWVRGLGIG